MAKAKRRSNIWGEVARDAAPAVVALLAGALVFLGWNAVAAALAWGDGLKIYERLGLGAAMSWVVFLIMEVIMFTLFPSRSETALKEAMEFIASEIAKDRSERAKDREARARERAEDREARARERAEDREAWARERAEDRETIRDLIRQLGATRNGASSSENGGGCC